MPTNIKKLVSFYMMLPLLAALTYVWVTYFDLLPEGGLFATAFVVVFLVFAITSTVSPVVVFAPIAVMFAVLMAIFAAAEIIIPTLFVAVLTAMIVVVIVMLVADEENFLSKLWLLITESELRTLATGLVIYFALTESTMLAIIALVVAIALPIALYINERRLWEAVRFAVAKDEYGS